jgi:protein-tyrosine-phosphatase
MAVAVATQLFGDTVHVESAGVTACEGRPAANAVQAVRQELQIDISHHLPRNVDELAGSEFDLIVALDPYVADRLDCEARAIRGKLVRWDIADPYLSALPVYAECLQRIRSNMEALRSMVGGPRIADTRRSKTPHRPSRRTLPDQIAMLDEHILRWQEELSAGTLRLTTLQGVASKAASSLEQIARALLQHTLDASAASYSDPKAKAGRSRPLEKLPLGEVVGYLRLLYGQEHSRRATGPGRGRQTRRTPAPLTESLLPLLDQVTTLRNTLAHDPESFAPDEDTLVANTTLLLGLVQKAVRATNLIVNA